MQFIKSLIVDNDRNSTSTDSEFKFDFQKDFSFDKRKNEAERVIAKYPDRIPVICELDKKFSKKGVVLDKKKYLIPNNLTVGQFVYVIRKRIKLLPEESIFLFTENNTLPMVGELVANVQREHRNLDSFTYFSVQSELVYGAL
jgi:GABA(A) receptor-associated protein